MLNITNIDSHLKEQTLIIHKAKGRINGTMKVFMIQDGEYWVTFMPALDLTGYGKTTDEADSMLKEALDDYFMKVINLKSDQIQKELSKYGWVKGFFSKRFKNSVYVDKEGILKNFELPKDTPIKESMVQVD